MSKSLIEAEKQSVLRHRALSRLGSGNGLDAKRVNAAAALSVLHDLASSPATAADALAVLHELQVHQVELELQDEELRTARIELEAELGHRIALYDLAPVGLLTVDHQSVVHELNLTGARLLGQDREQLPGQALTSFLAPGAAQALRSLQDRARAGAGDSACQLHLGAGAVPPRVVLATARFDPATDRFLLALMLS